MGSSWTSAGSGTILRWARLALLSVIGVAGLAAAGSFGSIRYQTDRATLYFEPGQLTRDEMGRFAALADRGVADVASYLGADRAARERPPHRITFEIGSGFGMARAYRNTIYLPVERVRDNSAPYLHETAHVLLPTRCDCPWLAEGFASYVQSYVSEHLGGYDGAVFSRGGNANVDQLAKRYLATSGGRDVVAYIGGESAPPRVEADRRGVAAPFYVLSHSFAKFLVEELGLELVKSLHEASEPGAEVLRATGRDLASWREEWLGSLTSQVASRDLGAKR
jgi:hypothetical protein